MPSCWPRDYTPPELRAIARSIGRRKLDPEVIEQLQDNARGYQWALRADQWDEPRSTHKRRNEQLNQIVQLCEQGAAEELEIALNELDALTSRFLGLSNRTDLQDVKNCAHIALNELQRSGPDRKYARLQFIKHLARIFKELTGARPRRRVRDRDTVAEREYGPFRDFVLANLAPFGSKATKGVDADIRKAIAGCANFGRQPT
jgi:hypothetical protein